MDATSSACASPAATPRRIGARARVELVEAHRYGIVAGHCELLTRAVQPAYPVRSAPGSMPCSSTRTVCVVARGGGGFDALLIIG